MAYCSLDIEMVKPLNKPSSVLAFSIFALLIIMSPVIAFAQAPASSDNALVVIVNIERIKTQLLLAEQSLDASDSNMAFAHAFIPHTAIFPSVKDLLKQIDSQTTNQLESLLSDLPFKIKEGNQPADSLKQDIRKITGLLDIVYAKIGPAASDKSVTSQAAVFLLRDAIQSYQLSNGGSSQVDYENAIGLAATAESKYKEISSSMEEQRISEIDSFFSDLKSSLEQKASSDSIASLEIAIERDLAENLSLSSGSSSPKYFSNIRILLTSVVADVKAGNYKQAEQDANSAYLDNFEFLEAPLEKHDANLKVTIELAMREDLRSMIQANDSPVDIEQFVNGILAKLGDAEQILKNDPDFDRSTGQAAGFADIEALKAGFGAYTGDRKDIGQADDPAKEKVRNNIDQIRAKLDGMLQTYKDGNYDGALAASRSAYLDSYENIETPLRPINPDFTLEMEIKFAELRNLIQSHAPYDQVQNKVVELRSGLDESERLVSGTGIIAPAIAFSTSFSIVFREGLESALIVGAILTYLEASRNERFKKHVYYGIVLAFAATAVTWFVAQFIIEVAGASKAMIEAIAGVSAVAVLFWVSFWILNKVETKKWIEFVKAKVWKATTTGSVMVFVMLSFFTVYREGFETVLFYQAMISFAKYMEWYVAAGLLIGLGVITGITFVIRKLGKKLPLRVLFGLTMGIGAYMSIAFMGNAVREFQEVGYISTTDLIGTVPRLDINMAAMTGIHPTLETIVAQVILLAVYLAGSLYVLVIQPKRNKAIESARKSRADLVKKETEKKNLDLD